MTASYVSAQKYEAEHGDFYSVRMASEQGGYSADGYVEFLSYDESSVGISVTVPDDGLYAVRLRIINIPGQAVPSRVKVECDESAYVCSQRLPVLGQFGNVQVNTPVYLLKGDHVFYITGLGGKWMLDYLELNKVSGELVSRTNFPPQVTENPSKEAQSLYAYLCSMSGKRILSGQQIYSRTPEMKAIADITGKYPAVLGIDFIDYSPSRVEYGTHGITTQEALKWWKSGGIVAACWHWNAPAGLVNKNEPDKHWYDGFRTTATTFDFVKGLDDHRSEEYKLMLRDIDVIAEQLKILQDAGVPVLWRPLHEASGGWFWWGAKGKDNYIRLYRLLFDRLRNYHRLNNLIWVWNGQNPEWYPGDEYADIVSYDIYPDKREYSDHRDELSLLQSCTEHPKLLAFSENGTLPDIEKLAEEYAPWSYFCTWNGDFAVNKQGVYSGIYTDEETFRRYYANDYVITRDELPDFRNK
jgi:mannan endo-1,4-beta-mannosidase